MKYQHALLWNMLLIVPGLLSYSPGVAAQLTATPAPIETTSFGELKQELASPLSEKQKVTISTLRKILLSQQELQEQLQQATEKLNAAETEEQQTIIRKKIQELYGRLQNLEQDFESVATGIDLTAFSTEQTESFDWQQELQELLNPLIDELKAITARPRELEKLRNQIASYEKRIDLAENALKNINHNLRGATANLLKQELSDLQNQWSERQKEFHSRLATAKQQLADREKTNPSILVLARNAFRDFFKSRGLNLFLALLAFIAMFLLMRFLQKVLYKKAQFDTPGTRAFFLRLAGILYYILTFLASTIAMLFVLYMSGDWVLLGLVLAFLFGMAWTGKQAIPRFWEQTRLLLNLSAVREGERVMYNGLPWRVLSLNFYTRLHNPDLKGGMLRMPLGELIGLQSRPYYRDEPWFPTREGDLVKLADDTIGVVKMQTPEQVMLDTLGGCYKTFLTPSFLQLNPINFSINTFGIFVTLGLDYAHQTEITRTIPEQLRQFLAEKLAQEAYGKEMISLVVEFKEASASSLDVLVAATFPGKFATSYFPISRALQRICVDACNAYGWGIPFLQVTIHQANAPQDDGNRVARDDTR